MSKSISALHIRFEGRTASFCFPLVKSGTQVSTPVPSYSNILGLVSACAGRTIKPSETRVGFEFHAHSQDLELERKDRLVLEGGRLKPFSKKNAPKDLRLRSDGSIEIIAQGVGNRQVYWNPRLDLYITNTDLGAAFENPAATPYLGRSQDIAWIILVREIKLYSAPKGSLGPTLIPMPLVGVPGLVVRLPEWMENSKRGYVRKPGPSGIYQAMSPTITEHFEVERKELYHPSDAEAENHVIYLHGWLEE